MSKTYFKAVMSLVLSFELDWLCRNAFWPLFFDFEVLEFCECRLYDRFGVYD